jgi:hypothetical protein
MSHRCVPRFFGCAVLALLAFAGRSSRAQVLAYEDFNYAPGTSVVGLSGGDSFGWANPWSTSGSGVFFGTNTPGSLSYTDLNSHTLTGQGGSLIVGSYPPAANTTATPNRNLPVAGPTNTLGSIAAGNLADPGSVWISFMFLRLPGQPTTTSFMRQANLGFFRGVSPVGAGGTEIFDVGGPNTSGTVNNFMSVWGNAGPSGAAPLQSTVPVVTATPTFVLMHLIVDNTAATDSAYVWFNLADISTKPADGTATLTDTSVDLSGVNNLRFQAGNGNASGTNALYQADELIVGSSFGDVTTIPTITPEPSSLALAGMSTTLLLVLRRRRSRR